MAKLLVVVAVVYQFHRLNFIHCESRNLSSIRACHFLAILFVLPFNLAAQLEA